LITDTVLGGGNAMKKRIGLFSDLLLVYLNCRMIMDNNAGIMYQQNGGAL